VGIPTGLSLLPSVGLSVCRVCPVGELWKTADWIWIPFGMVCAWGRLRDGVLDGVHIWQGKVEVFGGFLPNG